MNDTETQACPRILTRCPSCQNDTLTINAGHLLCTWHECKDPTLIDRVAELVRAGDRVFNAGGKPEELKALVSATCSAAAVEKERSLLLWIREVTAILAYQIDIPHQHKVDLGEALDRYQKSLEAAQQQNDQALPQGGAKETHE